LKDRAYAFSPSRSDALMKPPAMTGVRPSN
jgi:hypothetical protein